MRSRSEQEFAAFVAAQWPYLVRTAQLMVGGSLADGEDVAQAALVRLAQRWSGVADPMAYVRRILVNLAADRWRGRARRPEVLVAEPSESAFDPVADPSVGIVAQDRVAKLLAPLPARQRQVLVLRYLDNCSEREVAAALGLSAGSVKRYSHLGLKNLRNRFETGSETMAEELLHHD